MGLTVPSINPKQLGSGAPLAVTVLRKVCRLAGLRTFMIPVQYSVLMKVIHIVNHLIGDHAENWNRFSEPMEVFQCIEVLQNNKFVIIDKVIAVIN